MVEDEYGIIIEDGIANAYKGTLNFTQIYNLVHDQLCKTVSKTTIIRWLRRLEEEEIVIRGAGHRMRNEVYYSLTPARIFERQLFPKSKESVFISNIEGQQEPLKKACLLSLLQSALGTDVPKVAAEPVLGAVYGRNECLISDRLPGVTMKEVLEHKNIGLGGLFDHVNFTRLLQKDDCVKKIQNVLGPDDNIIRRIVRNDEIANEIVDDMAEEDKTQLMNDFIKMCACMTSWIHSRLSDTVTVALLNALYKKGNLTELPPASFFSNFELDTFKSYLSLYGRKELSYEFKHCKEIVDKLTENVVVEIQGSKNTKKKQPSKNAIKKKMRELVEKRKDEIMQSDKNIIAFYHGLIKCDRYVDAPGALGERDRYAKYCKYVKRDIPEKYRYLTDILMKLVYPSFLQRYHNTNPKLVEFTKSLPCVPD